MTNTERRKLTNEERTAEAQARIRAAITALQSEGGKMTVRSVSERAKCSMRTAQKAARATHGAPQAAEAAGGGHDPPKTGAARLMPNRFRGILCDTTFCRQQAKWYVGNPQGPPSAWHPLCDGCARAVVCSGTNLVAR